MIKIDINQEDAFWGLTWAAQDWFLFVSDAVQKLGAVAEYKNGFVTKLYILNNIIVWNGNKPIMNGVSLEGGPTEWLKAIQTDLPM